MVNERPVRILLECILVFSLLLPTLTVFSYSLTFRYESSVTVRVNGVSFSSTIGGEYIGLNTHGVYYLGENMLTVSVNIAFLF